MASVDDCALLSTFAEDESAEDGPGHGIDVAMPMFFDGMNQPVLESFPDSDVDIDGPSSPARVEQSANAGVDDAMPKASARKSTRGRKRGSKVIREIREDLEVEELEAHAAQTLTEKRRRAANKRWRGKPPAAMTDQEPGVSLGVPADLPHALVPATWGRRLSRNWCHIH